LDKHRQLKRKFEAGEFTSSIEWTNEACKILKINNLTEEKFSKIINDQPFIRGAGETILELKKLGYKTAIITGSFSALAKRLQKEFGVDEVIAHCDFKFNRDGKLKNWKLLPCCGHEDKVGVFLQMVKRHRVIPSECVYVGDDVNDISVFQKVGLSIAFNCNKKEVKDVVDIVVEGKDLRLILKRISDSAKKLSSH
jgi:phosphoserine phosphatase